MLNLFKDLAKNKILSDLARSCKIQTKIFNRVQPVLICNIILAFPSVAPNLLLIFCAASYCKIFKHYFPVIATNCPCMLHYPGLPPICNVSEKYLWYHFKFFCAAYYWKIFHIWVSGDIHTQVVMQNINSTFVGRTRWHFPMAIWHFLDVYKGNF